MDRERGRQERANMSLEKWKAEKRIDRGRKKYEKERKSEIDIDFEKLSIKHKKRVLRSVRTGKKKLTENLQAKKGMRIFREEGRLKPYADRVNRNRSETDEWNNFLQRSQSHADMVEKFKPDIIQKINEKARVEKERLRLTKEKENYNEKLRIEELEQNGGEWVYSPEYAEYYWVGEGEPTGAQDPEYIPLSEEELKNIKQQEQAWLEADIEEKKQEARDKRRNKQEQLKAAMDKPIKAFPEKELCEYEKLREKNIKERMQAMEESGFFEGLNDFKKEMSRK